MKADNKPLIVALIFDEMSTRKHSQWDPSAKEYIGHVTVGKPEEYEYTIPLCKEVLVLMVSGIGEEFKLPIGYFFSNGIGSEEKAAIVNEALYRLNNTGSTVGALVFDGPIANIETAKKLGAKFNLQQPYFANPFDKNSFVNVILDPPHMIKLSRNCLGNKNVIYNEDGDEICWKFIEQLHAIQLNQNINLGNKLTKTHIEYQSNKMNVKLAAQTISNSVATSIDYLNKEAKLDDFRGSEATTQYLRIFNNIFDIMNTKQGHTDKKFKRPFTEETIDEFIAYFQMVKNYIKGLRLLENGKVKDILKTRSHTPFFGFFHNMTSFVNIYRNYIIPNGYSEFYTFNVSQDHLETFFGAVRSLGGKLF